MGAEIKRPIQIFNGTDWDKILPEISEDMIKSGFAQNLAASGYKKLPGGLIIQWGRWLTTTSVYSSNVGAYRVQLTFPVAFTTKPCITTGADYPGGLPTIGCGEISMTSFCLYTKDPLPGCYVSWIAIGY